MEQNSPAVGAPVEPTVRPLVERLRELSRRGHWPLIGDEAADEIVRLRAELQHARNGLTKGRTRMREDLERHKPLVQAVEWVVEEGHMHVEDLARLRAALDGLRPNVVIKRLP